VAKYQVLQRSEPPGYPATTARLQPGAYLGAAHAQVRKFRESLTAGDAARTDELTAAVRAISKASSKGVLQRRRPRARIFSRLSKKQGRLAPLRARRSTPRASAQNLACHAHALGISRERSRATRRELGPPFASVPRTSTAGQVVLEGLLVLVTTPEGFPSAAP